MKSISRNADNGNSFESSIETFFSQFQIFSIARKAHATKTKGISFKVLWTFLVSVLLSGHSSFRNFQMQELPFSEKTYRNLLNNPKVDWQLFLACLAQKVTTYFSSLTSEERKNVFIVDDSMYERLNAKKVELAALQFDHASHTYKKGFRFLQLGWSDGNSYVPVSFSLLSGKNKVSQENETDRRSLASKRKEQAQGKGTEVMLELLNLGLKRGLKASYVLFDSWFSSPKMFQEIRALELHAVTLLKRSSKVHYFYQGHAVDVKSLFQQLKKRRGRSRYLLSVEVEAHVDDAIIPIKLVYVRNRNKRKEYLVLATTDITLSEDEIIQLYGKRWAIEVFFKMCKQYLQLAKYQGLSYDGIFAHTTLVCVSDTLLSVQHRQSSDDRTIGDLFYLMISELADLTFEEAIFQLLEMFQEALNEEMVLSVNILDDILEKFLAMLPKATQNRLKKANI